MLPLIIATTLMPNVRFVSGLCANPEPPLTSVPRCTRHHVAEVKGWLIDLDGVLYDWNKLLPGANLFVDWLHTTDANYALVSNSFKTPNEVVSKFARSQYRLNKKIQPDTVVTCGTAVAEYLQSEAPKGSRIYLSGTNESDSESPRSSINTLRMLVTAELYDSWSVRESLDYHELMEWATTANKKNGNENGHVFVLIAWGDGTPNHLSYEDLSAMVTLITNGAKLVVGGIDTMAPFPRDTKYPDALYTVPWVGALEQFLLSTSPQIESRHVNVGKGGGDGVRYMMTPAVDIMKKRNASIRTAKEVVVVGDNVDTDIAAANAAGLSSILVLTGVSQLADLAKSLSRPTCYVDDLDELVNTLTTSH